MFAWELFDYSKEEIEANNRELGPRPIWCETTLNDSLEALVTQRYRQRDRALQSLFAFDPVGSLTLTDTGYIDVTFINEFYSFFYVDHPCLCDKLVVYNPKNVEKGYEPETLLHTSSSILPEGSQYSRRFGDLSEAKLPQLIDNYVDPIPGEGDPQKSKKFGDLSEAKRPATDTLIGRSESQENLQRLASEVFEEDKDDTEEDKEEMDTSKVFEKLPKNKKRVAFYIKKSLGAGKAGETFIISNDIQELVLKRMEKVSFKKYLSLHKRNYEASLGQMNPSLDFNHFLDQEGKQIVLSVEGDNFSNQTCLHMILDAILRQEGIENPNYIFQYDAFFCHKEKNVTGYNIMELAELKTLSEYLEVATITDALAEDMIRQILTPLRILKHRKYGFHHADLKGQNIFVGGTLENPVFKIADYDKSSISWRGTRFFNSSGIARKKDMMKDAMKKIFLTFPDYPPVDFVEDEEEGAYYRFNLLFQAPDEEGSEGIIGKLASYVPGGRKFRFASNVAYETYQKAYLQLFLFYSPFGFFASHDVYTFFFSLMMEPPFYRYIRANQGDDLTTETPLAYNIWRALWFPDQYDQVMYVINTLHTELADAYLRSRKEGKEQQKLMRSISFVVNIFVRQKFKFRYDLDAIYNLAGVPIFDMLDDTPREIPQITITKDNHVLVNRQYQPKGRGSGGTNKYGRSNLQVYRWDWYKDS